jgi:hypothetical protein
MLRPVKSNGAVMSFSQLIWGVKSSFRSYVEAAGGSITVGDGATQRADGTFIFPAVPGGDLTINSEGVASGTMRFQGMVLFEAHGGMLKSTLAELGIEAGADGLTLTVLEGPMNQGRCAVADLGSPGSDTEGRILMSASITMDGMYQIADNYPPGTELDPVILV